MPTLLQKDLCATPDGVAVVDNQDLDSRAGNAHRLTSCFCDTGTDLPTHISYATPGQQAYQLITEPFQSLPCAHHIQGKSNSWALLPTKFQAQYHVLARRSPRHKSTHRLNTSKSLIESQLKLPSHRMQQLYLGSVAYSRTRKNLAYGKHYPNTRGPSASTSRRQRKCTHLRHDVQRQ